VTTSASEQMLTTATIAQIGDDIGVARRPLLKRALVLGLVPAATAPVVVLGAIVNDPHAPGDPLFTTGFRSADNGGRVRLVRYDQRPIRPQEISLGGLLTVYPDIPHGTTNEYADSPGLLFHLPPPEADLLRRTLGGSPINVDAMFDNFVVYSKICTHAGCPASLYEQQTNRLLCPCHQSQFLITDMARPIFGPASRPLPMLPIDVDDDGYFVATSDYLGPVGPAFWEMPRD
jgi:ubiquinol-cytochrome c reductase iron-sulfur subunit